MRKNPDSWLSAELMFPRYFSEGWPNNSRMAKIPLIITPYLHKFSLLFYLDKDLYFLLSTTSIQHQRHASLRPFRGERVAPGQPRAQLAPRAGWALAGAQSYLNQFFKKGKARVLYEAGNLYQHSS